MKYFILFICFVVFVPTFSIAQKEATCYQLLKEQGEASYNKLDFEMAVKKFRAAQICPDRPVNSKIDSLLELARNGYIDKINEARTKAEKAEKMAKASELIAVKEKYNAEKSARLSKAGMLAFQAQVAIEKNKEREALCFAWNASQLTKDSTPTVVKRAFGDATYYYSHLKSSPLSSGIQGISFSTDGTQILCITRDHKLTVLALHNKGYKDSLQLQFETEPFDAPIAMASFSPDGQEILVAAGSDIKILDNHGNIIQQFRHVEKSYISASYSPDGNKLLICPGNSSAEIWNKKGNVLAHLSGHHSKVFKAGYSADGKFLFTLSKDKTVRIWTSKGRLKVILEESNSWLTDARFSTDGKKILTTSVDGLIKIWSIEGVLLRILKGHRDIVRTADFFPSGEQVLSYSADQSIILWNKKGEIIFNEKHQRGDIRHVDFSKDSQLILSASMDGTAKLWNLQGELLMNLDLHKFGVTAALFSPDNNRILTCSDNENFVILAHTPSFMRSELLRNKKFALFCEEKNISLSKFNVEY